MIEISVVIPTRNRQASLTRTLGTLQLQTIDPQAFEVLVVADGCTDGTAGAVRTIAEAPDGPRITVIEQAWAGAAAARNQGLQAASGEFVLFLDDDMDAAPHLLAEHLKAHRAAPRPTAVLGRIMPQEDQGALSRELARWWEAHYTRIEGQGSRWTDFYTGNVSLPTKAGQELGGLDTALDHGEDIEFGWRLGQAGLDFTFAPDAVSRTRNPKD